MESGTTEGRVMSIMLAVLVISAVIAFIFVPLAQDIIAEIRWKRLRKLWEARKTHQ